MENRNGLIVDAMVTQADGTAERDAALLMVHRKWRRNRRWGPLKPISVGADKAYDTQDFVTHAPCDGVRPHVAQNLKRPGGSTIDQRTTRHKGYQTSQRKRPLIEKAFGWMKQTGGMRKTKLQSVCHWVFQQVPSGLSQ